MGGRKEGRERGSEREKERERERARERESERASERKRERAMYAFICMEVHATSEGKRNKDTHRQKFTKVVP